MDALCSTHQSSLQLSVSAPPKKLNWVSAFNFSKIKKSEKVDFVIGFEVMIRLCWRTTARLEKIRWVEGKTTQKPSQAGGDLLFLTVAAEMTYIKLLALAWQVQDLWYPDNFQHHISWYCLGHMMWNNFDNRKAIYELRYQYWKVGW